VKSKRQYRSGCLLFNFSLSIFFFLLFYPLMFAQEHPKNILSHYIHKIYTSNDGLPHNSARALVQTQEGYLWIATQDGLVRFDGASFQVFNKDNTDAFHHNDVTTLIESADSTLWIGTYNGLISLKKGKFVAHPTNAGKEHEIVRALSADREGNIWIGTMNAGIQKYKNGKYEFITTAQGLTNNSIHAIAADCTGNIWIGTEAGVNVYNHGQWTYYHRNNGLPHESIHDICVASDSTVLIGTSGGISGWKNDSFRSYSMNHGLPDNVVRTIYEDRSHTLWIGTSNGGICQFSHGIFSPYGTSNGLSGDMVVSILEDLEGSIWVGTYKDGLNQFCRGKFRNYTGQDGVPDRTIRAMITAHDGSVWIGTEGAGVLRFDGKKFSRILKNELPSDYIRSLFEDSQKNYWIGLREGLAQYRDGKTRIYTDKDGLTQNFIRVIGEDREGTIWAGTYNGGVHRLENGRFVNYYDKGMSVHLIRSILVDREGALWIGSNEGLLCRRAGTVKMYTYRDGLPLDPIFDMLEDSAHTLWMGSYGGGLVRIKNNKITRYTYAQGLSNDIVLKILEDNFGNLWLSSMQGISSISKKMLNDFADGKIDRIQCNTFDASDGMIVGECSGPAGCKTSDGHLWFPTPKGIVVVDPQNMKKNNLAPPVIIERVVIDREEYSPYESARFLPGNGEAEFIYGAMSFIAPRKVHFKYLLEGFEKEWVTAGTRRGAFYTNLAPGKYVFHVIACNSDGMWNEAGTSFAFELEPHFYQTNWFYFLALSVVSGVVFGLYRLRVVHLLKREKELELHISERTAQLKDANKELEAFSYSVSHDLRSPLLSIDGFSNAVLEDYSEKIDEQGKDYLQRVRAASRHMEQLIDDMLKLSRITRSEMQRKPVDLSALAQNIATDLQKAQPERKVTFDITPGLMVQADRELLWVVLENLLENAWKFTAKNPEAKIEIGKTPYQGQETYYVRDNGVGFNMAFASKLFGAFQRMHTPDEFEGTGIGLATVRRIIHRHGGRVWAESEIKKGSIFYFTLQGEIVS
jgi:ligand-binding sensor domain-containing protein/signal transduction histidine kinase